MKNSKQKQQDSIKENSFVFKNKYAAKIFNSTWGLGALLAAISAWTAGMLYV